MFCTPLHTILLTIFCIRIVTAQNGVTYVTSIDGTATYPCPSIEEPETYYQDKCASKTVSGIALTQVEVRNTIGTTRDDWEIYQFCYYGSANDYCSYTASKANPALTQYGSGLGTDCPSLSAARYDDPSAPKPVASDVARQSDNLGEPAYTCPSSDGDLNRITIDKYASQTSAQLGFGCSLTSIGPCYYTTAGAQYSIPSNKCPATLCPNHYDSTFTRRRLSNSKRFLKQVKAQDIRRTASLRARFPQLSYPS
ncbi:uncharacterized protein IL334_000735 [Kwoniella shivajii]|uniref:Secreted protein n=1 Tax=Kwoniella shivajii TaxID=564305 RepID=A0ABZ1CQA4_9TREE|nr:hypothetical protein IL334_000735 [Kwoniella shivajii]